MPVKLVAMSASTPTGGVRQAVVDGLVITWRNLKRVPRIPELAIFAILQSIIFVLLFSFVFGGAIQLPDGGSYREFLLPGIFAQTVAFASVTTAIGMCDDLNKGIIDRFRSLPMARSAVLSGRTLNPFAATGFPAEDPILLTLIWVAILVAVFAPLGVWRYRAMSR